MIDKVEGTEIKITFVKKTTLKITNLIQVPQLVKTQNMFSYQVKYKIKHM